MAVPSTEPFDPHEINSIELLGIVKARLWEDGRIDQADRVPLVQMLRELTSRVGSMARKK